MRIQYIYIKYYIIYTAKNIYIRGGGYTVTTTETATNAYIYIYLVWCIYTAKGKRIERIRGGENTAEERVYALYASRSAHDAVAVAIYIYIYRGTGDERVGRLGECICARVCVCVRRRR